jgi:peptidoglycan biosynthesis protein MviN/MurJ (putative lipid II flippase)
MTLVVQRSFLELGKIEISFETCACALAEWEGAVGVVVASLTTVVIDLGIMCRIWMVRRMVYTGEDVATTATLFTRLDAPMTTVSAWG